MSKPRTFAPLVLASALFGASPAFAASPFQGVWCGNGLLHEFSLKLAPGASRGEIDGTIMRRGRARELRGNVEGGTLHSQASRHGRLVLAAIGSELRIVDGDGPLALVKGSSFRRGGAQGCGS
jgi:hypothetical protein